MPKLWVKVGSLGLYPPPGQLWGGCGVLLHTGTATGDWEGLVPARAGQWAAAGVGCFQKTQYLFFFPTGMFHVKLKRQENIALFQHVDSWKGV